MNVYNTKTGNQLPGWPQAVDVKSNPKTPSPALADFDFDGLLEIVVAAQPRHTAQSTSADLRLPGQCAPRLAEAITAATRPRARRSWPTSPATASRTCCSATRAACCTAGTRTGSKLAGFPLTVGDFIRSVPFADDVDGDGGIDLVLSGWDKNVYIWDFPVPYVKAAAQWPTLRTTSQRSGFYEHHITSPTDVEPGPEAIPAAPPARAYLAQNHPNPFNPTTSIAYGVAAGIPAPVRLDVYDVSGRHVRELVNGIQSAGHHRALWDGRDARGSGAGSGVYFVRLRIAGEVFTRKMLLVK